MGFLDLGFGLMMFLFLFLLLPSLRVHGSGVTELKKIVVVLVFEEDFDFEYGGVWKGVVVEIKEDLRASIGLIFWGYERKKERKKGFNGNGGVSDSSVSSSKF